MSEMNLPIVDPFTNGQKPDRVALREFASYVSADDETGKILAAAMNDINAGVPASESPNMKRLVDLLHNS